MWMKYPTLEAAAKIYVSRAQGFTDGESWIVKAWDSNRLEISSLLGRADEIIKRMSEDDAMLIGEKFEEIIPDKSVKWREGYDEQFRNVIVEILGWGWLADNHPSLNVGFYPRPEKEGAKSPDLGAWDEVRTLIASMECKHLGVSNEEKEWIKSGEIKSGPVTFTTTLKDPK